MIGIIDIGNTTFNCGKFKGDSLVNKKKTNNPSEVANFFSEVEEILCISVVPSKRKLIEDFIGFKMIPFPVKFIQLDYNSEPGEDRLANGLSAKNLVGLPVIVVDCGSAITVDLFTEPTNSKFLVRFEGGAIMPGFASYFSSVAAAGNLLPDIEPGFQENPGKDTEGSIKFGAFGSLIGGTKEVLQRLDYKNKNLIFTGGNGEIFSSFFEAGFDSDLTLSGGLIAYNRIS